MKKNNTPKLSDNEVIDLYLDTQSQYYFSMLYARYSNKVYSKCLSLLKNEAAAQDASQDVFMKIFLNLSKFNQKSRFSTWVYSITYNYCIDFLRRKKKEKTVLTDEDQGVEDVVEEVGDKEIFEMEIDRLKEILNNIPLEDKMVLLMKYREGLSIKEIGEVFKKSESAIKMKLKRAKHKVREQYNASFKGRFLVTFFFTSVLIRFLLKHL